MGLITWDDNKYSVGIASIDAQHKQLVELINKLHEAMMKGSSKAIIKDVIAELMNYTKTHFTYEEELMQKFSYGDYETHKKTHASFVERVFDFQEKYLKGEILLSIDIINFLRDWLIKHISGTDKKYTDFFISKGVH